MSNGVAQQQAPVKPGEKVGKVSPATFTFIGVIAAFKPYQGKQLATLRLPDGDEYGVEAPADNYPIGLQCELHCEVPQNAGFNTLFRATGRFGVFGIEREVQSNQGGYNNRNTRGNEPRTREYQNLRFAIEKLEVVKVG